MTTIRRPNPVVLRRLFYVAVAIVAAVTFGYVMSGAVLDFPETPGTEEVR